VLAQVHSLLESDGQLVIADGFAVDKIQDYEAEFTKKFQIVKKDDITYNVRNARYLSVERHNRIAAHGLHNTDCLQKVSNLFYSLLPEEKMDPQLTMDEPEYTNLKPKSMLYRELDLSQRQYLIYVLKPLHSE